MTTSEELIQRARVHIPGGVNSPVRAFGAVPGDPLFIERGEGAYLWDADAGRDAVAYRPLPEDSGVVFGGLTLLLRDPTFIKWKPTVVNWLFAAAFLLSQFFMQRSLLQRMMDHAIQMPADAWRRLNTAWISFFFAMGVLNLFVAYNFSEEIWVNFKLFGMMGLTIVFVIGQAFYLARHVTDKEREQEA